MLMKSYTLLLSHQYGSYEFHYVVISQILKLHYQIFAHFLKWIYHLLLNCLLIYFFIVMPVISRAYYSAIQM